MDFSDKTEIEALVKGCVKGDERSQHKLYKHFYGKMMGVCYRYSKSSEDAKDILHDGFVKVFNKLDKFNFEGSFEGWIRRIMVNTAIDHYRKGKHSVAFENDELAAEDAGFTDEDAEVYSQMQTEEIIKIIQTLSPAYQTVFNMYVIDGYSHKEIADELNITVGTSKSNLAKARMNIQKLLLKIEYER